MTDKTINKAAYKQAALQIAAGIMRLGCLKWFKPQYREDVSDINVVNKKEEQQ